MAGRARAAARKAAKKDEMWGEGAAEKKWRDCGLCGRRVCINNNYGGKVRIIKWRGYILCAWCQYNVIPVLRKLHDDGVIKIKKPK